MINYFYEENKQEAINTMKIGLENIQDRLRVQEEEFHRNVNTRDWHVKDKKSRRLWTQFGDVILTRRQYISTHGKGKRILFDESIGLVPYLYIQPCYFLDFIKSLNKVRSYKALSEIFGHQFSSTQISNILKKQDLFLKSKQLRKTTEILFVNLDDIYVLQHKEKKTMIRCGVAYTGVKKKYGRNSLIEKTFIPINPNIPVKQQVREFESTLINVYGNIKRIVVVGDGANWITTFSNYFEFCESNRYIDQFHYKKYIKDMLGRKVKVDWNYLLTLKKDKAIFYLLTLVTDKNGEVHLKQPKLISKVRRWFSSWKKCTINKYPNVIEGIQSTQVAITLKNRRSFSKDNAYKILMLNAAEYNKWNITFSKPKNNIFDFNQPDCIIKSLTSDSFTNIPIIESREITMNSSINAIINWNG